MERTARPIVATLPFEREVARYYVDDVRGFADTLDDVIAVKCHAHKIRKVWLWRQGLSSYRSSAHFCDKILIPMKQGCAITYLQE